MFRFASDGISPLSQTVDSLTARRTDRLGVDQAVLCLRRRVPGDPGTAQCVPPA